MPSTQDNDVFGRELERAAVVSFLDDVAGGARALVLEGEAGIGKTTIWREALKVARQKLYWTLSCRSAEAEAKLGFAALADLLEPVVDETLPHLPEPQRHALDAALLRRAGRADVRTVAAGTLGVLRRLAALAPVVVAIDDAQWLDSSSMRVLEFVIRRLDDEPVLLFIAQRPPAGEATLYPERLLPDGRVDQLPLQPLEPDDLARLLHARLGGVLPRPALLRIHRAVGGNPLFALEVGRSLVAHGGDRLSRDQLVVPADPTAVIATRIAPLRATTKTALLAAAALSRPLVAHVLAAVPSRGDPLREAVEAGLVQIVADEVEFAHPLIASIVYSQASSPERSSAHTRLARIVDDLEERAHHLALATERPNAAVAAEIDAAADRASRRGAIDAAAQLKEHAVRLTPPDQREEAWRRAVTASAYRQHAGDTHGARAVLESVLAEAPPGAIRADALERCGSLLLREGRDWEPAFSAWREALDQPGIDDEFRARVERNLAAHLANSWTIKAAEPHARLALELAERSQNTQLLSRAIGTFAHVEFMRGRGLRRELFERAVSLERLDDVETVLSSVRNTYAWPLILDGALDRARVELETLLQRARERGEYGSVPQLLFTLADLERFAGNWSVGRILLAEGADVAAQSGMAIGARATASRAAWYHACEGDVTAALAAHPPGGTAAKSQMRSALDGFVAWSLGDAEATIAHLEPLPASLRKRGLEEPAFYWAFAADLLEALIALGRLGNARPLLGWLEERGRALDRAWALAIAFRCGALLCSAEGDAPGAMTSISNALREHERLPMPFEVGRTLLVKGAVERRAKQKRGARESLAQAASIFERLGAPLWAKKARNELSRVGGRTRADGLSATEEQIANLVAEGRSNREIAEAMFLSVKTVEGNLSRIYREVGVRSRTELARKLLDETSRTGRD